MVAGGDHAPFQHCVSAHEARIRLIASTSADDGVAVLRLASRWNGLDGCTGTLIIVRAFSFPSAATRPKYAPCRSQYALLARPLCAQRLKLEFTSAAPCAARSPAPVFQPTAAGPESTPVWSSTAIPRSLAIAPRGSPAVHRDAESRAAQKRRRFAVCRGGRCCPATPRASRRYQSSGCPRGLYPGYAKSCPAWRDSELLSFCERESSLIELRKAKGQCMCCDSTVRWPSNLSMFRCTICLSVNDLVPAKPMPTEDGTTHKKGKGFLRP